MCTEQFHAGKWKCLRDDVRGTLGQIHEKAALVITALRSWGRSKRGELLPDLA